MFLSVLHQSSSRMVLCEDGECSVCLLPYSRTDRIPRVLHCMHTFCDPCLKTISQSRAGLVTVPCPLCRRVTCIGRGLGLQEALWVNDKLWEQIPEEEDGQKQAERMEAKQQPSFQAEWWVLKIKKTGTHTENVFVFVSWNYDFLALLCLDSA